MGTVRSVDLSTLFPRSERRRSERRRQEGAASLVIVYGMAALLLVLVLAIDSGAIFTGRTQLQSVADAAARAALGALTQADPDADPTMVRTEMEDMARTVAAGTGVTQGGLDTSASASDVQITFGRYDFKSNTFTALTNTGVIPSAVRVDVQRSSSSSSGPLQRVFGSGAGFDVAASSISAFRARNLVVLVDTSASFAESIVLVQAALEATFSRITLEGGLDEVGLVAFRNHVVDRTDTGQLVTSDRLISPGSGGRLNAGLQRQIDALDDDSVLCKVTTTDPPLPFCVGTDLAGAFVRAESLLRNAQNTNENIVVVLADGDPCEIKSPFLQAEVTTCSLLGQLFSPPVPLIGPAPPGEVRGGGSSVADALAAARQVGQIASVVTIAINTSAISRRLFGRPVNSSNPGESCLVQFPGGNGAQPVRVQGFDVCLVLPGGATEPLLNRQTTTNDALLLQMVSGFGSKLPADKATQLAASMARAMSAIPPVTVE